MRALGAVVVACLSVPAPLYAHARLIKSQPSANEVLATPPDAIRLWFSEEPEIALTVVTLRDASGGIVGLGPVSRGPATPLAVGLVIPVSLRPGTYTVEWRTAAEDGHPTNGSFEFTVSGASANAPTVSPAPPAVTTGLNTPAVDASSPAYAAIRWFSYSGMMLLIGALVFHWVVVPHVRARLSDTDALKRTDRRAAMLGMVASGTVALAAVGRLLAQAAATAGSSNEFNLHQAGIIVSRTQWGAVWIAQLIAALAATAALDQAARRLGQGGWLVAAFAAFIVAFTPGLSGHAVASQHYAALMVLADSAHVIAAGSWLGSLVCVVAIAVPTALALPSETRGAFIAPAVQAYSPIALGASGVLLVTGAFAALLRSPSVGRLIHSQYGQMLLVKLAVVCVLALVGLYNWRMVLPMLASDHGAARLKRSARVELLIGAIVVAVTAVLVATPTPT